MKIKVRVPATTANVGCGFDTLGIALNLYTIFTFEEIENGVEFVGFEEKYANENNLVYTSFLKTLKFLKKDIKGVKISIDCNVPVSRGLGSSSTCVVGGIYGAFGITNTPLNKDDIFTIANNIEGHPDNVSPAIFGGLSASCVVDNKPFTVSYDIDERFNFLALVPNFETLTEEARKVIPATFSKEDTIYNLSRLGVVLKSFENYDLDTLSKTMGDKIHEPYRKKLIYEYEEVKKICQEIDSVCFLISGSGSTLMNIVRDFDNIKFIEEKLKNLKYSWRIIPLKVDKLGTVIEYNN